MWLVAGHPKTSLFSRPLLRKRPFEYSNESGWLPHGWSSLDPDARMGKPWPDYRGEKYSSLASNKHSLVARWDRYANQHAYKYHKSFRSSEYRSGVQTIYRMIHSSYKLEWSMAKSSTNHECEARVVNGRFCCWSLEFVWRMSFYLSFKCVRFSIRPDSLRGRISIRPRSLHGGMDILPCRLVLRTRGLWKILPLITRVCMKNVSIDDYKSKIHQYIE